MKQLILPLCLAAILLSACGQIYEDGPDRDVATTDMRLSRHSVEMFMDDYLVLHPIFTPAGAYNAQMFWISSNTQAVRMEGDTLVGVRPGTSMVKGISVQRQLQDSCLVNVVHRWAITPADFQTDMVLYANAKYNGRVYNDSLWVAAFCNGELRGLGTPRTHNGTPYTELRIYSNRQQGDKITFKCYNHVTHEIIPMSQAITFDGQAHGNLSSLFELSATSDNL